nr:hypothetical protein [Methylobacterium sp. ZNC0032]
MKIEKKFPPFGDAGTTMSGVWFPPEPQRDQWGEIDRIGRLLDAIHPRPTSVRRPASDFVHLADPDELAFELNCSFHLIDLNCSEIQRLIESTRGSFQGTSLIDRLTLNTSVGMPKPIRRKRLPKGKQPILPNLFSFANELAADQASDED